jgi:hypothetical protein
MDNEEIRHAIMIERGISEGLVHSGYDIILNIMVQVIKITSQNGSEPLLYSLASLPKKVKRTRGDMKHYHLF